MANEYDVVVIGGGPAGEVAAGQAAADGLSTLLIEGERVGGECSYWACIPSKALLRPPEVYDTALKTPGVRPAIRGAIDPAQVFKHRDAMAHGYDDSSQVEWLKNAGVKLLRGKARFVGPRQLTVTDAAHQEKQVTARKAVVVAVGSVSRMPDIRGLREAKPWTNREATAAKAVPRRLVLLGGGPVSLELGYAWKSLGTEEVTIIERGARLLPHSEPFVGEQISEAFRLIDIGLRLSTQARQVRRGASGEVTVTLDDGSTLLADEILVATGRLPATRELGLETIGLVPGERIEVDDSLRAVGVKDGWLYAVGDANGRNLLTHMGKYQARILGDVLNGRPRSAWADERATPQVIFTQPQIAAVGLTEAAARQRGLRVRAVQALLADLPGYSEYGPAWRGTAKFVVDEDRQVLVGATFVGLGVGEMLHAASIAVAGEVKLEALRHAVPAFPTVNEIWLKLLE